MRYFSFSITVAMEVVSLGTGTKCIGQTAMSPTGVCRWTFCVSDAEGVDCANQILFSFLIQVMYLTTATQRSLPGGDVSGACMNPPVSLQAVWLCWLLYVYVCVFICRYLIQELHGAVSGRGSSVFCAADERRKWKLRPRVSFLLFTSHTPCECQHTGQRQ